MHQTSAVNAHGIHSPFVFELYNEVLCDDRQYYVFEEIEAYRSKLLNDRSSIQVTDLGAGSQTMKSSNRRIRDIAKTSLQKPKHAQLLFRLAMWAKAENMLELGTSLGITSAYLGSASSKGKLTTIEGCPEIARVASTTCSSIGLENVHLEVGNFDDLLTPIIEETAFDFVLLDGNHSYDATMRYVDLLLSQKTIPAVIVLDDIYWSKGMTQAWRETIQREEIQVSLDLFDLGILFVRPGIEKQDFRLKV